MYADFYGLTRCPFQFTPDPACYFEGVSQRQALSTLADGLARGEGFVVLTGPAGVGKTTLVAQALAMMDRDHATIAQLVGDHLIRNYPADSRSHCPPTIPAIAAAFGATTDAIAGLAAETHDPFTLDALLGFLREEVSAQRRCILVVDEAQALPTAALDALRLMSDFHLDNRSLLQIVLVGQPELHTRLLDHPDLERLRERIVAAPHLEPLGVEDVELYIHHRLTCAGWEGNPGFAAHIPQEIHAAAEGLPRRINQIVDRLLTLGAARQQAQIHGGLLAQVLAERSELTSERREYGFPGHGLKSQLEVALARSESQIAELRQAFVQLGGADECHMQIIPYETKDAALEERLVTLESRLIEQDRTIRHTLTMLIEWIERDDIHHVAA